MGASQSQAEDDSHGHSHADGSVHHGHSHSHGGRSSSLVPAALTAAQLQGAPTVAPNVTYLSSTHAPVTLAAPSAAIHTSNTPAVAQVAHPDFTHSSAHTANTGNTVNTASTSSTEPVQVGHHPQAAPTGVVNQHTTMTTTTTKQHDSAGKTAAVASGAAVVGAAAPHHPHDHHPHTHHTQHTQQQQPANTSSSSSYGAVPISGQVIAPISSVTVVPTTGHTHAASQTSAVVSKAEHTTASKEVVRPIDMQQAAVQPGFASEAAAGKVVTPQPAVHAGPSAERATLAALPVVAATTIAHVAPVSTGQAVAPPTLYQTVAPGGQVTAATTTQPADARASATTAVTAGTVSSTTSSTATATPATAPATSATTTAASTTAPAVPVAAAGAGAAAAATKSNEPGSPGRPEKVAKGMQTGLWSRLIQWCNPLLPQGVVLAWDERDVAEMVLTLPHSPDFKATLQQRQLERKKRRKQQAVEQADAAAKGMKLPLSSPSNTANPVITSPHSTTQLAVPYELASVLLSLDKALSAMRLQWVPSRVSEDTFFVEYFGAIVAAINAHVTRVETELTGKMGGPTVHDRVSAIEERAKA